MFIEHVPHILVRLAYDISMLKVLRPSHARRSVPWQIMPEFQLSSKGMKNPPLDVFAGLDGKTKSAVTRYYNSTSHKSQALVETMQAPKKSRKAKAPPKDMVMEEVRGLGNVVSWSDTIGWMLGREGAYWRSIPRLFPDEGF